MSAAPILVAPPDASICTDGDSASTIDGEHAGRSGDIKSAPSMIDGVLSVQVRFYGRLGIQWIPVEHLRITRNVTYDTGSDHWRHRQRTPEGNHRFLGPCPMCGSRTFDYGGGWACTDYRCSKSPGNVVCNNGPEPSWWNTEIRVHRDGDTWFASGPGFQSIHESLCGFGGTPDQSVAAYHAAVRIGDPVAPTAAPAGSAPITIPAGAVVTVTLSAADALYAGQQMRSMARGDRCGSYEDNELFARVGGQLAAAARASAVDTDTSPNSPYELGRLDAERGAPRSDLLRFVDDALAQAEYQLGLTEHARYYLVFGLRGLRIQHGPFLWNTAVGEQSALLGLPDTGIDDVQIIPSHDIEVR